MLLKSQDDDALEVVPNDLASGAASDVCCKAQCYKVPCPNDAMANDTTACAAACPQGSGTPADTQKYAQCQQSCFSSLFFPATASGDSSNGQATAASTTGSGAYVANTGTYSVSVTFRLLV